MVNDAVRRDSSECFKSARREEIAPVALMNISPELMNQLRYAEGNETRRISTSNDTSVDSIYIVRCNRLEDRYECIVDDGSCSEKHPSFS